jgi:flagellar protein FliS
VTHYNSREALKQYRQLGLESEIDSASPHKLIQLLFAAALNRIAVAQGAIERGDIPLKGSQIGKALGIVSGLRSCVDLEVGGELAQNLDGLYEYIGLRLLKASSANDLEALTEAANLLKTLKSGWDGIAGQ